MTTVRKASAIAGRVLPRALFEGGAWKNPAAFRNWTDPTVWETILMLVEQTGVKWKRPDNSLVSIDRCETEWTALAAGPPVGESIQATWVGHSTVLVQCRHGERVVNCLTDPIFSQRATFVPWRLWGPKRFTEPSFSLAELAANGVPVDVVLISHNHYDHLDSDSVEELHRLNPHALWCVPAGLIEWFTNCGIDASRVRDADWWSGLELSASDLPPSSCNADDGNELRITIDCLPAQHWSSRTFALDYCTSLWCSWAVRTGVVPSASGRALTDGVERREWSPPSGSPGCSSGSASTECGARRDEENEVASPMASSSFWFAGDTGYDDRVFELIGDVYSAEQMCSADGGAGGSAGGSADDSAFDLALVPVGAYEPRWYTKPMHCTPEEAVEIHRGVRAKHSIGIHWGTFALADEDPYEAPARVAGAVDNGESFTTPRVGEVWAASRL